MNKELLNRWHEATGSLPWGVQKQFLETLVLVSQGKTTLVYGADYNSNMPCLVNANANVIASMSGVGGTGKPSRYFGAVVAAFDSINGQHYHELKLDGHNPKHGVVHPETADLLIENFGDIKTVQQAIEAEEKRVIEEGEETPSDFNRYVEPSDADLWADWAAANREVVHERDKNVAALRSE